MPLKNSVDGTVIGNIGKGYLVLIGVGQGDTRAEADRLVKKMLGLRIFPDENGKINLRFGNKASGLSFSIICVSRSTLSGSI